LSSDARSDFFDSDEQEPFLVRGSLIIDDLASFDLSHLVENLLRLGIGAYVPVIDGIVRHERHGILIEESPKTDRGRRNFDAADLVRAFVALQSHTRRCLKTKSDEISGVHQNAVRGYLFLFHRSVAKIAHGHLREEDERRRIRFLSRRLSCTNGSNARRPAIRTTSSSLTATHSSHSMEAKPNLMEVGLTPQALSCEKKKKKERKNEEKSQTRESIGNDKVMPQTREERERERENIWKRRERQSRRSERTRKRIFLETCLHVRIFPLPTKRRERERS